MKKEMIGIDVSKSTLDLWLHHHKLHNRFSNDRKGFEKMLKWIDKVTGCSLTEVSFCFEHTGLYSLPLSMFFNQKQICFYVVSGLLVKRSLGLVRGKNDQLDARNIARFLHLHKEELQPHRMPCETLVKLKQLHSHRAKMVKQRGGYKAQIRELKQVLNVGESNLLIKTSRDIVSLLTEKIKAVEVEMLALIKSEEELFTTYTKITGIKGVGMILAVAVMVTTHNFRSFKNWRKFACYAGTAPFEHRSGTSYKGRTRVSSLGNRQMKTLLSQAAATAIQHNPELKVYYQRRLSEGKSKMSTLNIIRNKIISRMFAVAKRQTPFVETYKFAA